MRHRDSDDRDESHSIREPQDEASAYVEHVALDHNTAISEQRSNATARPDVDQALSRTIESEIIPRLLMTYRGRGPSSEKPETNPDFDSAEIETFADIAMDGTFAGLQNFVEGLRTRGMNVDTVIADFLPAAARHIGWLWETDARTFVDVTFASARLQQVLRHYAPSLDVDLAKSGEGRRVLLSAMPGEQHTFGLSIVEEFFRHAAWDVVPTTPVANKHLIAAVRDEWFDVVGLSAGADATIAAVQAIIQKVRSASLNRSLRIIVGGNALARMHDGGATLGADAIARDPREALTQMEWMMQALQQPC